ncbi:unnamed protein product [Victoria cruziana]
MAVDPFPHLCLFFQLEMQVDLLLPLSADFLFPFLFSFSTGELSSSDPCNSDGTSSVTDGLYLWATSILDEAMIALSTVSQRPSSSLRPCFCRLSTQSSPRHLSTVIQLVVTCSKYGDIKEANPHLALRCHPLGLVIGDRSSIYFNEFVVR